MEWLKYSHVVHDTESAPDFWCTSVKKYKDSPIETWEISKRKNDLHKILQFYGRYRGKLISFNGKFYDNSVVNWIVNHKRELKGLNGEEVANKIYVASKAIITGVDEMRKYKYGHKWTDVDLFMFWSNLIRQNKGLSLKTIAIALKYDEIQELPYDPDEKLESFEKFDEVIRYNRRNDIGVTEKLCEFFEQRGEMELRKFVEKQYNIKPWSLDGVNIGSEILKHYYKKEHPNHDFEKRTWRKSIYLKDVLLDNYDFKTTEYGFTTKAKPNSRDRKVVFNSPHSAYQYLKGETVNNTRSIDFSIHFNNPDGSTLISDYGSGGIHGIAFNGILEEDEKHLIVDIDVSSYYPTLVVNNEFVPQHLDSKTFIKVFSGIIDQRLKSKKLKKESKFHDLMQSVLKLSINGSYGFGI